MGSFLWGDLMGRWTPFPDVFMGVGLKRGPTNHSSRKGSGDDAGLLKSLDPYLKLAEECAKYSEAATTEIPGVEKISSPNFNKRQCQYLAHKLGGAVRNARGFYDKLDKCGSLDKYGDVERHVSIFKFVLALAKQIQSFIQGCCKDSWVQAAMTLTRVEDHVSSLGFNSDLLMMVLINERSGNKKVTLSHIRDINKKQAKLVRRKAKKDLEDLCEKVRLELQSCNDGDKDLAGLLLQGVQPNSSSESVNNDGGVLEDLFKLVVPTSEVLGSGAVANVRKAMWLGTDVAQKTFYGVGEEDSTLKETLLLAKLHHPNITSMFASANVMHRPGFSIIMELMDEDLFSMMQRKLEENDGNPPFTTLESIDIMLQIGEGVNYLHNNNIEHKDLKSFKILVKNVKVGKLETGFVQAKVADFGLDMTKERQFSNLTFNRGTNRWKAPEMLKRNGKLQPVQLPFKHDAYSFGMVCYEILTGDVPFSAIDGSYERMVMKGIHPSLPNHCPLVLQDLIIRCWNDDPNKRPSFQDICLELKYMKYLFMKGSLDDHIVLQDFDFNHETLLTNEKPLQVSLSNTSDKFFDALGSSDTLSNGRQISEGNSFFDALESFEAFKNLRQIGKGASAVVYEVEWKGRKHAKKTFYGLVEFQDEVSMLEKLSHPHIMSLLYSGRDKNSCFLVMDLMDGDLFTIMQERQNESCDASPFPILIAVDIMHQVAEGVNYLHENNIVHRDLKAGNILVKHVEQTNSRIGNVLARVGKYVPSIAKYFKYKKGSELETKYLLAKVADFGLAKTKMKSKTTSEQDANVGTSRYMAPEIINLTGRKLRRVRGEKFLPFKCDVYSFAMLCYEVSTGNKPFPNVHYDKDVKKMVISNKCPELPQPYCPPELIALITKCWDKTPNKRPKFEMICEELEGLKASLKKGGDNICQDMEIIDALPSSQRKGARLARDPFVLDPQPKGNMGICTPCTWIISATILLALAILLALVMLSRSQA